MKFLKEKRIPAPEIDPEDWAAGEPHPLGTLRGRVVLLDLFSYADPDGVHGLSWLRALGDHYRAAGLSVVGVHVPAYEFEQRMEAAHREIWRLGIPYPVALDQSQRIYHAYESRNLPARYLIDREGFVRGWHHGPEGLVETEQAVRTLLREADPRPEIPPPLQLDPRFIRPGELRFLPTPEIRLGSRGVGFGPPESSGETPEDGEERQFGPLPELRAQGCAYLEGTWRLGADRITSASEEARLAVVYEGSSVEVVLSPADGGTEGAELEVLLDGEAVPASLAGRDLETVDGRSLSPVEEGRLYEWITEADFGIHHLDVRAGAPGIAFHLVTFGSDRVPEEA